MEDAAVEVQSFAQFQPQLSFLIMHGKNDWELAQLKWLRRHFNFITVIHTDWLQSIYTKKIFLCLDILNRS